MNARHTIRSSQKMFKIKVIGIDADDTLWDNLIYFKKTEDAFCDLMSPYYDQDTAYSMFYANEQKNIELYGYGVKSFILSMIETICKKVPQDKSAHIISNIIELGKKQLNEEPVLLEGVAETLPILKKYYKLVLATKGDLLDQTLKLKKSGLAKYFDHVEVMNEKNEEDYIEVLKRLNVKNEEFLMIGNSLRSDIIPVLNLGGSAIYIPYHTTWIHEVGDKKPTCPKFMEAINFKQAGELLQKAL